MHTLKTTGALCNAQSTLPPTEAGFIQPRVLYILFFYVCNHKTISLSLLFPLLHLHGFHLTLYELIHSSQPAVCCYRFNSSELMRKSNQQTLFPLFRKRSMKNLYSTRYFIQFAMSPCSPGGIQTRGIFSASLSSKNKPLSML